MYYIVGRTFPAAQSWNCFWTEGVGSMGAELRWPGGKLGMSFICSTPAPWVKLFASALSNTDINELSLDDHLLLKSTGVDMRLGATVRGCEWGNGPTGVKKGAQCQKGNQGGNTTGQPGQKCVIGESSPRCGGGGIMTMLGVNCEECKKSHKRNHPAGDMPGLNLKDGMRSMLGDRVSNVEHWLRTRQTLQLNILQWIRKFALKKNILDFGTDWIRNNESNSLQIWLIFDKNS